MTLKYFSHFYKLNLSEEPEWFDPQMNLDTKLYIDPFLLFKSRIPLFEDARNKFLDFFNSAFELAHESVNSITALKVLEDILAFPEASEICLGDSTKGIDGSGPGGKFAKACASALRVLALKGYRGLDHFEEIEIFTAGIGQDGISDATATILKKELILYTQQVCHQHGIEMKSFPVKNINFDFTCLPDVWEDGHFTLPRNPFPKKSKSGKTTYQGIILVPKQFLCVNHAISSDGFAEYIKSRSSQELRNALNYTIEKSIKGGKPSKTNKSIIVNIAQKNPDLVEEYIKSVEENQDSIESYNLEFDEKNFYRNQRKSYDFVLENPLAISAGGEDEFLSATELMINQFKLYVEDRTGYKLFWNDPVEDELGKKISEPKPRNEDTAQSLFSGIVFHYCQSNNIDLSRETNLGRGPVDFKFSSGYSNRALVELKLAKSTKLEQGALKQLPKYLKTEQTHYGYYVVILHTQKDFERLKKVREAIDSTDFGDLVFKLIAVDATRDKPSASNL